MNSAPTASGYPIVVNARVSGSRLARPSGPSGIRRPPARTRNVVAHGRDPVHDDVPGRVDPQDRARVARRLPEAVEGDDRRPARRIVADLGDHRVRRRVDPGQADARPGASPTTHRPPPRTSPRPAPGWASKLGHRGRVEPSDGAAVEVRHPDRAERLRHADRPGARAEVETGRGHGSERRRHRRRGTARARWGGAGRRRLDRGERRGSDIGRASHEGDRDEQQHDRGRAREPRGELPGPRPAAAHRGGAARRASAIGQRRSWRVRDVRANTDSTRPEGAPVQLSSRSQSPSWRSSCSGAEAIRHRSRPPPMPWRRGGIAGARSSASSADRRPANA